MKYLPENEIFHEFISCPHSKPKRLPFNCYKKNFLEREYKIKVEKNVNKILKIHNHKLHDVLAVLRNGEIVQEQQLFNNFVICHGVDRITITITLFPGLEDRFLPVRN